jgi:hypothetical protein
VKVHPASRLNAIVTAQVAGDHALVAELIHEDPNPAAVLHMAASLAANLNSRLAAEAHTDPVEEWQRTCRWTASVLAGLNPGAST